jgi:predicted glutamine amidotransferase
MCRLLGVVSATCRPLTSLLEDDLEPFTALSSDHCDGWGLAYRDRQDALQVRKAPETARTSPGYRSALAEAETDAALVHLRKASKGMVNEAVNTHPFTASGAGGRTVAFAHNGWASDMPALDAMLASEGGPPCQGGTDSERYFGLVLAALRRGTPPEDALPAVAARVYAAMRTEALNCLLLTDDSLYAHTSYDADRPTLSGDDPHRAYALRFRMTGGGVVVASGGWAGEDPEWEPLPNGHVLRIHRHDLRLSVHRPAPVPQAAVGTR